MLFKPGAIWPPLDPSYGILGAGLGAGGSVLGSLLKPAPVTNFNFAEGGEPPVGEASMVGEEGQPSRTARLTLHPQ